MGWLTLSDPDWVQFPNSQVPLTHGSSILCGIRTHAQGAVHQQLNALAAEREGQSQGCSHSQLTSLICGLGSMILASETVLTRAEAFTSALGPGYSIVIPPVTYCLGCIHCGELLSVLTLDPSPASCWVPAHVGSALMMSLILLSTE